MELIVSFASGARSLSLYIELGPIIIRLAPFEKLPLLCYHASFDWGSASSEHFLAASWKHDLHQHSAVYHQIAAKLGPNHPMAKLIQKELDKDVEEPASKRRRTSATTFWQETAKSFHRTLGELVQRVEQLTLDPAEAPTALQAEDSSWSLSASSTAASLTVTSSSESTSGQVNGSLASLQSGQGKLLLHLKLEFAFKLGSFNP